MSSSINHSRNVIDLAIKENRDMDDIAMKNMVENLLRQNYKLSANIYNTLCSQLICRPKTLRFVINYYRRNAQTLNQDLLKQKMSAALRSFVKEWHDCSLSQTRKIFNILLQNGADPFEKNRFNRDAFDYAQSSGTTDVMTLLVRLSPRNPIRRINQMIARESAHLDSRPYFLNYLNSIKRYFREQSVFHGISRIKTPLASYRQKNV